jgi:hypothetical protein
MLICVCLRILASSRIPRYDLGRQTPHFEVVLSHSPCRQEGYTQPKKEQATLEPQALEGIYLVLYHVCAASGPKYLQLGL